MTGSRCLSLFSLPHTAGSLRIWNKSLLTLFMVPKELFSVLLLLVAFGTQTPSGSSALSWPVDALMPLSSRLYEHFPSLFQGPPPPSLASPLSHLQSPPLSRLPVYQWFSTGHGFAATTQLAVWRQVGCHNSRDVGYWNLVGGDRNASKHPMVYIPQYPGQPSKIKN